MPKERFFEELMRTLAEHIQAKSAIATNTAANQVVVIPEDKDEEEETQSLQQVLSHKVLSRMAEQ